MATQKQRDYRAFFTRNRKAGMSAKAIGKAWKNGTHKARRNDRGQPLTGPTFRPLLPRGPGKAVARMARQKWKAATITASKQARGGKRAKPKKARKLRAPKSAARNPFYTVFNAKPKKKRKAHRNLSSSSAKSMALKRWYDNGGKRKGRKAHRNPGLMDSIKSVASMKTLQEGLAVLAGSVVAWGAPSLVPAKWNQGYLGLFFSLLAAGAAGVVAAYVAPQYLVHVTAGGVVIVGLRLVQQVAPRALNWAGSPPAAVAGFLPPPGSPRLAGYLVPPPGAIVRRGGRQAGMGLIASGSESFKSRKP